MEPRLSLREEGDLRFLVYEELEERGFLCRQVLRCPATSDLDPSGLGSLLESMGRTFGLEGALLVPIQVHGNGVLRASQGPFFPSRAEADGVLLDRPGAFGVLRFADCLPVVVFAGDRALILHCGFKGLLAGILEEGMRALGPEADLGRAEAYLGVGICGSCYTRRMDPFTERALRALPESSFWEEGGLFHFDIAEAARARLSSMGVRRILRLPGCTLCDGDRFFSHRRGERGRQVLIGGFLPRAG